MTHRLYFVDSVEDIETGPVTSNDVPAWQLTNNVGMSITAMAEGANMVQVSASAERGLNEICSFNLLTLCRVHNICQGLV